MRTESKLSEYYTKDNIPTDKGYEVIHKLEGIFKGNKHKLMWLVEIKYNPKAWDFVKIIRLHINGEELGCVARRRK